MSTTSEFLRCFVYPCIVAIFLAWGMNLGEKFVTAKIANDTSIAGDTRRIADALEASRPSRKGRVLFEKPVPRFNGWQLHTGSDLLCRDEGCSTTK